MPIAKYTGPNGTIVSPQPSFVTPRQLEKEAEREWWMAPMVWNEKEAEEDE